MILIFIAIRFFNTVENFDQNQVAIFEEMVSKLDPSLSK